MLIAIWKEVGGGRGMKYESRYETEQLRAPYAAALRTESEEAARDLVVQYMACVELEFSRRVDGAFLQGSVRQSKPTSAAPTLART